MNLIDVLGQGKDEARTRRELAQITGMEDRKIRIEIQKLRKSGVPVVNFGSGYYISNDPAELRRFLRSEYLSKICDMDETFGVLSGVAGVMER